MIKINGLPLLSKSAVYSVTEKNKSNTPAIIANTIINFIHLYILECCIFF